jgi:hypothetical protein
MKKLILSFAIVTFSFFTALAQYDILLKQGVYNNTGSTSTSGGDYAYGSLNTYDHQYDRKNDNYYSDNRANNNYTNDNRNNYNQNNFFNDGRDFRNTGNRRNAIVIKNFEVERRRKDQVELEFCILGPLQISTHTQWQGTTLFVYLDYPYNRENQRRNSTVEVDLGRLSKNMRYNVVVVDSNSQAQLGQYAIN